MTERLEGDDDIEDHMVTAPADPAAKTQPAEGGVDEVDDEGDEEGDEAVRP